MTRDEMIAIAEVAMFEQQVATEGLNRENYQPSWWHGEAVAAVDAIIAAGPGLMSEYQRTAAALEATCRREEAQRPLVEAAIRWKQADDAFGWGNGPPPINLGVLDDLRAAVQTYEEAGGG